MLTPRQSSMLSTYPALSFDLSVLSLIAVAFLSVHNLSLASDHVLSQFKFFTSIVQFPYITDGSLCLLSKYVAHQCD